MDDAKNIGPEDRPLFQPVGRQGGRMLLDGTLQPISQEVLNAAFVRCDSCDMWHEKALKG